ncbi:acyltransferase family protein [Flavobacterium cyclinae]|uniref:acyltransferase family protein n=1 Tax=Flavobacterium cyclinae TaxID=2895947 RepID=UPI001E4E7677|nr:acyltransferase [Flavobacterium cyclinae]UGS20449.1 acyltransferase [Flavobacterium cyclinae]
MDYQIGILIIFIVILVIVSVLVSNSLIKIPVTNVKYPEIDGLRGYLAFFVFIHHSYIWYNFLKTDIWEKPKSNLFNHLGETSVVFFFIITAFLFISKILDKNTIDYNWKKYLIARFYRLFPIYFFSICIIFILIAIISKLKRNDSFFNLIKQIINWILFTIDGPKNINNINNTFILNAGVTWTLPYEWMFYFLLPVFAVILKIKVNYKIIVGFVIAFLIILSIYKPSFKNFVPFIFGIAIGLLMKEKKYQFFKKSIYTFIALFLLFISINYFHSGRKIIPILISFFVLFIIANGNSFFGLLSNSFSRKLGQITYSIYLLHGIILFTVFYFFIGFEKASKLSQIEHWSIIALTIFPVILLSQITYKYIELPSMNLKNK